MDALDRLTGPANDLLVLVDRALARSGAPDAHPVWPLLRRVGALPGAAVSAIADLRPAPLAAAVPSLRTLAQGYADASAAVTVGGSVAAARSGVSGLAVDSDGWQGGAAEVFAARWSALSAHLVGGVDSMYARLEATAAYADSIASWMSRTRGAVAETLARVLTSAEAVAMVTDPTGARRSGAESPAPESPTRRAAPAHAEIAAAVLEPIAHAGEEASELTERWSPRLVELAYRQRRD
ncbi:MAG TPA: hypothetical protein VGJ63_23850 [Micromonosporaceae bacterium]|jgi:hypothetical protein